VVFCPRFGIHKTPSRKDGVLLCLELASGADLFLAIPPISQKARNGWGTEAIGPDTAKPFNNQARIQGRIRADLIRVDLLVSLGEGEGRGVDAVAQAGGTRAVGEDVAEMTAATSACDLNAPHAEAFVLMLRHGF
jgi:hypothetical protein